MARHVLVFNIGSSTNKLSAFEIRSATILPEPVWQSSEDLQERARADVLKAQLAQLESKIPLADIELVGHRVVHGGRRFQRTTLITPDVVAEIDRLCRLAPLHNPAGLAGIQLAQQHLPQRKQFAVFDTALHAGLPLQRRVYALPYSWYEEHEIQRYGFHGINHKYVGERAAEMLATTGLRIVSCHLGNGCSITALVNGESVHTSMGYTPLEGLAMGTRSGSIDPGIIVQILASGLVSQADLDNVLNKQSGLLGVSGQSNDMRELLKLAAQGNERCRLAIDIFVERLRCEIAVAVATMDGADALVFTGGIGENATDIRRQTCAQLNYLGAELDQSLNLQTRADALISSTDSRLKILVVTAQENLAIARDCLHFADADMQ